MEGGKSDWFSGFRYSYLKGTKKMKKVVIADDTPFMRLMLRDILERNGFQVVGEAENGKQAVEMYRIWSPDLITLDITMPEMDGLLALEEIMKIDPNARAIMVSAVGSALNVFKAVKTGAKNFITKPFNEKKIMDTISSMK